MRENDFLQERLDVLLKNNFADVERPNEIEIAFGRRAKRRFGSIKMDRPTLLKKNPASIITINGLFRDEKIPAQIIEATIAHELCHYAHGFSSPLPKKYEKPHQGGVIKREMKKRDLVFLYDYEQLWTKQNWVKILGESFPQTRRVRRRKQPKTLSQLLAQLLKP